MDKPKPNKLAQFYSGQIQPNGALSLRRSVQFWSGVDILAIGKQDTDIAGLTLPKGVTCLGATSDHMVIKSIRSHPRVGSALKLQMNYSALMRAMNAPDITKVILNETPFKMRSSAHRDGPDVALV